MRMLGTSFAHILQHLSFLLRKTQTNRQHCPCRVTSGLPITSVGLFWRGTSSSTRTTRMTVTSSESLFWRAAQSSCASLRSSLPFRWCGASRACALTSLPPRTRPARRAGSKPSSRPTTATCLCSWWTWRRSTKVSCRMVAVLFVVLKSELAFIESLFENLFDIQLLGPCICMLFAHSSKVIKCIT